MDLEYIESLAELVRSTAVAEVTVRRGERSVTLRRTPGGVAFVPAAAEPRTSSNTNITPAVSHTPLLPVVAFGERALVGLGEGGEPVTELVKARRVGFFRRAKAEGGEPLLGVGDWAAAGQQLASIESMRLYDEVESPVNGRVIGVFVEDGAPVQYGQPLFHVELCDAPDTGSAAAEVDG